MPDFELVAPFEPTGDQPTAIERLGDGLARGLRHQVLLGATGTGKSLHEPCRGHEDEYGEVRWRLNPSARSSMLCSQRAPRFSTTTARR